MIVDLRETLLAVATLIVFGLGFYVGWLQDWYEARRERVERTYDDGGCGIQ